MQPRLSARKIDLPTGNAQVTVDTGGGTFFYIVNALYTFEIRFDSGEWIPCFAGFKRVNIQQPFQRVEARQSVFSGTMEVQFVVGDGDIQDTRLSVVRDKGLPVQKWPTVMTGHSQTIAAGAEVDLDGTEPSPATSHERASTIVTNMDPAVDLEVLNQDDEVLDTVFFRSSKLYESSASLKVKNNTGAPVVARISQLWYVLG